MPALGSFSSFPFYPQETSHRNLHSRSLAPNTGRNDLFDVHLPEVISQKNFLYSSGKQVFAGHKEHVQEDISQYGLSYVSPEFIEQEEENCEGSQRMYRA